MAVQSLSEDGIFTALEKLKYDDEIRTALATRLLERKDAYKEHKIFYDIPAGEYVFKPKPRRTIWIMTLTNSDIRVVVPAMSKDITARVTKSAKDLYKLHRNQEGPLLKKLPENVLWCMENGWLSENRLSPDQAWDLFLKSMTVEDLERLTDQSAAISARVAEFSFGSLVSRMAMGEDVSELLYYLWEGYGIYSWGHDKITDYLDFLKRACEMGLIDKSDLITHLTRGNDNYETYYKEICRSAQEQYDYFKNVQVVSGATMQEFAYLAGLEQVKFPGKLGEWIGVYTPKS